ncbi:MAG: four helix bundle protein [Deltaproteobacteria bacterium]|nr:MAG: four helix bundle protein [Deltaproteobacteria bacterium]
MAKLMNVAEQVFAIRERFPKKDDYALSSQIRHSGLSVPPAVHWRKHLSLNRSSILNGLNLTLTCSWIYLCLFGPTNAFSLPAAPVF